jgi:hypothetical protein
MACLLMPLVFILLCWAMVRFVFRDISWRTMMQLEVILPLVAYLLVVFGLSIYAMRKRTTGAFSTSISSAAVRWAALCWQ